MIGHEVVNFLLIDEICDFLLKIFVNLRLNYNYNFIYFSYFIVLAYKMMFSNYFLQYVSELMQTSKFEIPRWQRKFPSLDFRICYHGNSG